MRRKRNPDYSKGLLAFEAAMREAGRPAQLRWLQPAPPRPSFTHHAAYTVADSEKLVDVPALPGDAWRAFVAARERPRRAPVTAGAKPAARAHSPARDDRRSVGLSPMQ